MSMPVEVWHVDYHAKLFESCYDRNILKYMALKYFNKNSINLDFSLP